MKKLSPEKIMRLIRLFIRKSKDYLMTIKSKKEKCLSLLQSPYIAPYSIKSIDNEALHEEELEKIVVSANELTVHSVEKNCNNIVFVAIRMVI